MTTLYVVDLKQYYILNNLLKLFQQALNKDLLENDTYIIQPNVWIHMFGEIVSNKT
jgi:hypothetical protein